MASTNANLGALALNSQNTITPLINGGTLGFALGTGSTTLLTANPQVQKVTFHNPGASVAIYVCQALDMNGNALTPGPNPGNFEVAAGTTLAFAGNGVAGSWLGAAATGSGNPFTVAVSQTP